MNLKDLVRPNIYALAPYSSARDEYQGHDAAVFLDANESPYNKPYNRYPDPLQREVKEKISQVKGVPPENIFLGNGSDEAIDLIFRVFCEPGLDNVVAIEPSYGMYAVCADINNVEYRRVKLHNDFSFSAEDIMQSANKRTKVVFLCSPNNPTGNLMDRKEILKLLDLFQGIVVVDEAYGDFANEKSWRYDVKTFPHLVVLNTFSKAWSSAAVRLGMAFADKEVIHYFNKVKYPYNVNQLTQEYALDLLKHSYDVEKWVKLILGERPKMISAFAMLPYCEKVYPTDANFFLAKVSNAQKIYDYLIRKGVVVRNRSKVTLCENCLRITIGTPQENTALLSALRQFEE